MSGRPGVVKLGDSQTIETYTAGDPGVPSYAGASGVHVNISGGDPCHERNGRVDIRQLDLWLRCNPDAGVGQPVVPNNGIETDHCEYDIIWVPHC